MADIELVIKIPEEVVDAIQNGIDYRYDIHTAIARATIAQGILLPKGHGKLIDADRVIAEMNDMKVEGEAFTTAVNYVKLIMEDAPTVIEADNSISEESS